MNLNEFMVQANRTIFDACKSRKYLTIGLGNECGEALGALKKYYRGDYDLEELRKRLVSELGDVLWYHAMAMKYIYKEEYPEAPELCVNPILDQHVDFVDEKLLHSKLTNLNRRVAELTEQLIVNDVPRYYLDGILLAISEIVGVEDAMSSTIDKLHKRSVNGALQGDGEGERSASPNRRTRANKKVD
jgi:NTP pyrophosphatase (non-canonical NTP hydrolase)